MMDRPKQPRATSPDTASARWCAIVALAALLGCNSAMDRYKTLPAQDRETYERCAMQRCGPAPQWKGEAEWAMRAYQLERDAHVACWDRHLDDYTRIEGSERRRLWLLSRCRRLIVPISPSRPLSSP